MKWREVIKVAHPDVHLLVLGLALNLQLNQVEPPMNLLLSIRSMIMM
jgi:hypothetical protein